LHAAEELPRIIAAADSARPGTTLAAVQAVRELWPAASPPARQQARGAIQRSANLELRGLDLAALAGEPLATLPAEATLDGRCRTLLWLSLSAFGLCGIWLRERQRGHALTI
jgi:hypothetical protein